MPHAPQPPWAAMRAQPHQYSQCVAAEPGSSWHGAGCSRSAGGLGCHPAALPPALCSAALAWDGLETACCSSWAPCSLSRARLCHRALAGARVPAALCGCLPRVPPLAWAAWGLPASGTCCSPAGTSPWAWRGLACPDLLPASAGGWRLRALSVLGTSPLCPQLLGRSRCSSSPRSVLNAGLAARVPPDSGPSAEQQHLESSGASSCPR